MIRTASILLLSAGLLFSTACSGRSQHTTRNPPGMQINASSREIVSGETVTFTARTQDTYGRDAKVKWSSTAGRLTTEQEGRLARVKFDEPGTYSVKAVLSIEGREVETAMVEVRVRPAG